MYVYNVTEFSEPSIFYQFWLGLVEPLQGQIKLFNDSGVEKSALV